MQSISGLPLTLRMNRMPMLSLLGLSILVILAGAGIAVEAMLTGATASAILGLLMLLAGVWACVRSRMTLRIDQHGLRYRGIQGSILLNWADMESVVLLKRGWRTRLGINFMPGHSRMTQDRVNLRESGAEVLIPAGFGDMGASALHALLERCRQARQPVQWLNLEQRHALALSALHMDGTGFRDDCLAGGPPGESLRDKARDVLATGWGVRDASEVLAALRWLDSEGHARSHQFVREALRRNPQPKDPLELLAPQERSHMSESECLAFSQGVRSVIAYGDEFTHISAWDGCRLIALARLANAACWMTEEEAWRWILGAARTLRQRFDSWESMSENYMAGRDFWGGASTRLSVEIARRRLLAQNGSPWRRVPWHIR